MSEKRKRTMHNPALAAPYSGSSVNPGEDIYAGFVPQLSAPTPDETFWFPRITPTAVKLALIGAHNAGLRVRLWHGDPATGQAVASEDDCLGYVTAQGQILVLRATRRANFTSLNSATIVRIDCTKGPTLYKHPKFKDGTLGWSHRKTTDRMGHALDGLRWEVVTATGLTVKRFETPTKAINWLKFMRGERYSR